MDDYDQPRRLLPEPETVYDDDDASALHYAGFLDDDVAVALAWAHFPEHGVSAPFGIAPPRRRWVRKVPLHGGGHEFVYGRRGKRGEGPVTVVEAATKWRHQCSVCGCYTAAVAGNAEGTQWRCRQHHTSAPSLWEAEVT